MSTPNHDFGYFIAMIGVVGDLLVDVVVVPAASLISKSGRLNIGSDTEVTITSRSGGSAANVAKTLAGNSVASRFIGRVGNDPWGKALTNELSAAGIDVVCQSEGRTGTVVVIVSPDGERTMLTDRASAADLSRPEPAWLDGLDWLHVPFYSLTGDQLGETALTLIGWAHERGIGVSIDASSEAVLASLGPKVHEALDSARPRFLLANEVEAEWLVQRSQQLSDNLAAGDGLARLATDGVVVHRGANPTVVYSKLRSWLPMEIGVGSRGHPIVVGNSTGAGDAFAAGFIAGILNGGSIHEAVDNAHSVARGHLITSGS